MNESIEVAKVGRKVGLKGFLKLHILSDFPEFFTPGRVFEAVRGEERRQLTVEHFDESRGEIRFKGFSTPEEASVLTHFVLVTTVQETREAIKLEEGEHFWFDVIGMAVYEGKTRIGLAENIEESGQTYLTIRLDKALESKQQRLLVPWIDHFVDRVDGGQKIVYVRHALELLEAL